MGCIFKENSASEDMRREAANRKKSQIYDAVYILIIRKNDNPKHLWSPLRINELLLYLDNFTIFLTLYLMKAKNFHQIVLIGLKIHKL